MPLDLKTLGEALILDMKMDFNRSFFTPSEWKNDPFLNDKNISPEGWRKRYGELTRAAFDAEVEKAKAVEGTLKELVLSEIERELNRESPLMKIVRTGSTPARFPGRCTAKGDRIEVGQEIVAHASGWRHSGCEISGIAISVLGTPVRKNPGYPATAYMDEHLICTHNGQTMPKRDCKQHWEEVEEWEQEQQKARAAVPGVVLGPPAPSAPTKKPIMVISKGRSPRAPAPSTSASAATTRSRKRKKKVGITWK